MNSPTHHKLFIYYSFLGGKLVSRRYKKLAPKYSFELAQEAAKTDVILAHSAGCWHIPENLKPSVLVLVGMPLHYENMKTAFRTATRNNGHLFIQHRHMLLGLKIFSLSTLYGLFQPRRNYQIMQLVKTVKPFPAFAGAERVIFVADKDDPYPHAPELTEIIQNNSNICFISMPGSHQDIWEYPERYLDLLK